MQRVRIGLTGLAFVFLAVLLAAIFTGHTANEIAVTPNLIEQHRAGTTPPQPAPPAAAEPLAELGVAPGTADSNSAAHNPPPSSAPPPR